MSDFEDITIKNVGFAYAKEFRGIQHCLISRVCLTRNGKSVFIRSSFNHKNNA